MLHPIPSLVVHVVFAIGGNAGAWGGDWLAATNEIQASWCAAVAAAGLPTAPPLAETARLGVQWGGFLVVICAWESGPLAAGLPAAFPLLQGDLQATLPALWGGTLVFH
jgi:hypothetical protein